MENMKEDKKVFLKNIDYDFVTGTFYIRYLLDGVETGFVTIPPENSEMVSLVEKLKPLVKNIIEDYEIKCKFVDILDPECKLQGDCRHCRFYHNCEEGEYGEGR